MEKPIVCGCLGGHSNEVGEKREKHSKQRKQHEQSSWDRREHGMSNTSVVQLKRPCWWGKYLLQKKSEIVVLATISQGQNEGGSIVSMSIGRTDPLDLGKFPLDTIYKWSIPCLVITIRGRGQRAVEYWPHNGIAWSARYFPHLFQAHSRWRRLGRVTTETINLSTIL